MKKFFEQLQRIFRRPTKTGERLTSEQANGTNPRNDLASEDTAVISLMELIERTKEGEYTCEETLDLLDEYVELVSDGKDVAAIMPLVKNHIGDCPDCTARFEALVKIVQSP